MASALSSTMWRHDPSAPPVLHVAAFRPPGDVHAPAARRGSARPRRRDRRRAVRRRDVVPARRPARPARGARAVVADPAVQLFPEGGAVRPPQRRRRRRHRRAAGEHRQMLRGGDRADRRDRRRRRAADRDRRRPFNLAADPPGAGQAPRPARPRPVRRAHRHLGRVLRRQVFPRYAVPPRDRGGADRRQAVHPGRHPRADVRRGRLRLPPRARHHDDRHRPGEGARHRLDGRADPPRRHRPGVHDVRHRLGGSGIRAGHRHARGRRADEP